MKNIITVSVLMCTQRNAKLISDGTRAAWVMGSQVRSDNTITAGAIKALEMSEMTHDDAMKIVEERSASAEERAAKREAERQARYEEGKKIVTFKFDRGNCQDYSANALRVKTTKTFYNKYRVLCHEYAYLPKSQVSYAVESDGTMTVNMPAWVAEKNNCMIATKVC